MTTGRINQVATVPQVLAAGRAGERERREAAAAAADRASFPEPISYVKARSRGCNIRFLPGSPDRPRYGESFRGYRPFVPCAVRTFVAEAELFRTVSDEYKRYTRPTCDSGLRNVLGSQCWKLQSRHSRATAKLPSSRARKKYEGSRTRGAVRPRRRTGAEPRPAPLRSPPTL